MRRAVSLALVVGLAALLGACNIIFVEGEPEFSVSDLTVSSNYSDPERGPYICNDATTRISYSFDYDGRIRRWTQALREYSPSGDDTERATYEEVIRPESSDATVTESTVTYRFTIDPETALEPADSQISPQQVPQVDTRLVIEATGTDGETETLTVELPTECLTQ